MQHLLSFLKITGDQKHIRCAN